MSINRVLEIASSALDVQRARMEAAASNLANAQTTRTPEGGPYQRRLPVVAAVAVEPRAFGDELARSERAVELQAVQLDPRPPVKRYEPGHPDADAQGYVAYPNVDPAEEMVDILSAIRSYEASVNVVKIARQMNESALGMVR
ncbi:MAG: flagellar basal body rod protein FlgC [Acidobacteria bacterium]|nr:flagellar basal body rod protein FlgC [Acidobacteriota bacterium]